VLFSPSMPPALQAAAFRKDGLGEASPPPCKTAYCSERTISFVRAPLYTGGMNVVIRFCQSAFKHGITEADIRWAIGTVKYDGCLEDDEDAENKRLLHCCPV
jgi:hypothetical protein